MAQVLRSRGARTIGLLAVVLVGSVIGGFLFQASLGSNQVKAQGAAAVMAVRPPSFSGLADAVRDSVVAIGTKKMPHMPTMGMRQMPFQGPEGGDPNDLFQRFFQFFGPEGAPGGPNGGSRGQFRMFQEGDKFQLDTPRGQYKGYKDENGQWWVESPDGKKEKWNPGERFFRGPNSGPKENEEQPPAEKPEAPSAGPESLEERAGVVRTVGSGVVISADGYIVTNCHVANALPDDDVWVVFADGSELKAKLVGKDAEYDVAVLKVENGKTFAFTGFGDSDAMKIGDWVMAVGHPFGLDHTFTVGILSARGRHLDKTYDQYLQTDAAIHPGNSGGPLYDMDGQIIGINTAIATDSPLAPVGQGVGFAIPSKVVERAAKELMEKGEIVRGYIGVSLANTLETKLRKTDHGALLLAIAGGGPAAKAGLQKEDVIISLGGQRVENSDALIKMVAQTAPGGKVQVQYIRNGETKETTIEVIKRPPLDELRKQVLEEGE